MNKNQLRTFAIESLLEENSHAAKTVDPLNLHILSEEFYPKDADGKEVKSPSEYSVVLREGYHYRLDISPEDRPVPIVDSEGMPPATKSAIALASQLGIDLRKIKPEGSATGKIGVKDIYRVEKSGEAKVEAEPKSKSKTAGKSKDKAD